MTKFFYTAIKHRRLFAFIAVLIIGFTIISVTTRDIVYATPAIVATIGIVAVVGALLAAGGIKVSSDQLSNVFNDIKFRLPTSVMGWITGTAAGLLIGTINKVNISPAILKDFCDTVKGSVVEGVNGITDFVLNPLPFYNSSGEFNPSINGMSISQKNALEFYRTATPAYFDNVFELNFKVPVSDYPYRIFLFSEDSGASCSFLSCYYLKKPNYFSNFYPETLQIGLSSDYITPGDVKMFIVSRYPLYDDYGYYVSNVNDSLVNSGFYLSDAFFSFKPFLYDGTEVGFTTPDAVTVPLDNFGDIGLNDLSDFADTQIIDGVTDIPVNIPIGDGGAIVIPDNPSDIIDIGIPSVPVPPVPDPPSSDSILDFLKNIFNHLGTLVDLISTFFEHMEKMELIKSIKNIPRDIFSFFSDFINLSIQFYKDVIDAIVALPMEVYKLFSLFIVSAFEFRDDVVSGFVSLPKDIYSSFSDFIGISKQFFVDVIAAISNTGDGSDSDNGNIFGFLSDVVNAIRDLGISIVEFFSKITDFLSNLGTSAFDFFKMIFIPKEDYFPNKFTEMKNSLETKLPVVAQFSGFMSTVNTHLSNSEVDSNGRPSFSITVWGTTFELVDFSLFDPYLKLFQSIILVFAYFFFIRRYFSKIAALIGGYG